MNQSRATNKINYSRYHDSKNFIVNKKTVFKKAILSIMFIRDYHYVYEEINFVEWDTHLGKCNGNISVINSLYNGEL